MPLNYIIAIFFIAVISGCTVKPTTRSDLKINIIAASDINRNKKGEPSPVQVFIYGVKNRDNFSAENPLKLVSLPQHKASNDYVRISDLIIHPGEKKSLLLPLHSGSNTFAFVAAFREMENNQWSVLQEVDNSPRYIWSKLFTRRASEQDIRLQASTIMLSGQGLL